MFWRDITIWLPAGLFFTFSDLTACKRVTSRSKPVFTAVSWEAQIKHNRHRYEWDWKCENVYMNMNVYIRSQWRPCYGLKTCVPHLGLPWWLRRSSVCLQCGRPGLDPWVGKILWRRKWQPTPVLLPGKSHGQRSLVGYSPWGRKESDTTEQLHFTSKIICY